MSGRRGISPSKKQQKKYRGDLRLRNLVKTTRFDDMMAAVTGGGTHSCACCRIVRPIARLGADRVCDVCCDRLSSMRDYVPASVPASHVEPDVVWTDASFKDGTAGLAVVGALGEHRQRIAAASSAQAEVLALKWAMEIARADGRTGLTFRTDCQAAWRLLNQTRAVDDWRVEQISRRQNTRADYLAGRARTEVAQ